MDKGEYRMNCPECDTKMDEMTEIKWFWRMDYCKKHFLSPAKNCVWKRAENAWKGELVRDEPNEKNQENLRCSG